MNKAEQFLPSGFLNMTSSERLEVLKENADKVTDQTVQMDLDQDQKDLLKDRLAHHSLELNKLEKRKKIINDEFKADMDPHKNEIKPILESLRTGVEEVEDTVYWIFDHEEKRAYGFTLDGKCVDDRRLRPDEYQTHMKTLPLNGTKH